MTINPEQLHRIPQTGWRLVPAPSSLYAVGGQPEVGDHCKLVLTDGQDTETLWCWAVLRNGDLFEGEVERDSTLVRDLIDGSRIEFHRRDVYETMAQWGG